MRIAKYISNAGFCSRRDAEKLIIKKKVYINNELCKRPDINVLTSDKITICGKIIKLNTKIKLYSSFAKLFIILIMYSLYIPSNLDS